MMSFPLTRGYFGALAAIALLAVPLSAQTEAGDRGTFQVLVGGRPVGTEEFAIRQTGAGESTEIVAVGRANLQLPTGTLELGTELRTTGFQAQPVRYQVVIGGTSPRKIVGTVAGGRFSARIETPSGEEVREYLASNGATVLDDGVAHHYYFLASRTRSGRVPVIVPRENRQVLATVTSVGEERVQIGTANPTLYHIVVRPDGGDERHVWVDALSRVIKVEIPARDYVAVRTVVPE